MAAIVTPGQPVLEEQPQPAAPKPAVYGKGQYQGAPSPDFNKIQDGSAVDGMDGYSWYHTGSRGGSGAFGGSDWVQAQTGSLSGAGAGAPGGQAAATPQTVQQSFQSNLQKILSGPSADEAGANLDTTPQAVAFRDAQQRYAAREAQQLAEDNAVGGGMVDSQGLAMAQRALRQQQGESEGQFMADLSTQRVEARRGELQNAMAMAAALGDAEAARTLQLQIAQLDADTRNRSTEVTRELGVGDMDVRRMLGLADIDLRRYGIDTDSANTRIGYGLDAERIRQDGNKNSTDAILELLK